jgi:hypothetical protein
VYESCSAAFSRVARAPARRASARRTPACALPTLARGGGGLPLGGGHLRPRDVDRRARGVELLLRDDLLRGELLIAPVVRLGARERGLRGRHLRPSGGVWLVAVWTCACA